MVFNERAINKSLSYDSRLNIEGFNMNQKSQSILSTTQDKLHQLQSEIEILEMQIDHILKEQRELNTYSDSPIYISDRFAKTGIRLTDVDR